MNNKLISEIQIVPVKPDRGLVAFCSFVLFESLYCSSVAIFTRPEGGYRLVYPNKKLGMKSLDLFYPISRELGSTIQQEVINKLNDVMINDRYGFTNNSEEGFRNQRP